MRPKAKLIEMLRYMRPEGSVTQRLFCERFIQPLMGEPDKLGNYIKVIGSSNISFMAHHDTVHHTGGIQKVYVKDDIAYVEDSNCLGADCTTGVWLILEMIKAKVPGVYVIHAAEEIGCKGSQYLVQEYDDWLHPVDIAISFDRFGKESIITHQCNIRTASDKFAEELNNLLDLDMMADTGGVYTDSNEYAEIVSECTNLSVGYYNQHTKQETQDLRFAMLLRDRLIKADWVSLGNYREPEVVEPLWEDSFRGYPQASMVDIIKEYPHEVAEILESYGIGVRELEEEIYGVDIRWTIS